MKKEIAATLTFFLLVILAVITMIFASGCKTQKHITRTVVNKDSLVIESMKDSIRVLKIEVEKNEQLLKEYEYNTVYFDSTKCPKIIFPQGTALLNRDSIQRLITDLNNAIEGLNNKVKVFADGSTEYSGRIRQVNKEKSKLSYQLTSLLRVNDSLRKIIQEKSTEVKTKEVIVEKVVKRTYVNIWLFVICFVGGIVFWARFGGNIKSFLKPLTKKS